MPGGKLNSHLRVFSVNTFYEKFAAVVFNNSLTDGKPQTGTFTWWLRGKKWIHNLFNYERWNTYSIVLKANVDEGFSLNYDRIKNDI